MKIKNKKNINIDRNDGIIYHFIVLKLSSDDPRPEYIQFIDGWANNLKFLHFRHNFGLPFI